MLRRSRFIVLAVVGTCLLGWNAHLALACNQSTGCMDPYWADFWLTAYSDGHSRRALLGQLVGMGGATIHYVSLNLVAGLVLAAALVPLLASYFKGRVRVRGAAALLLFVVTGPLTMVWLEVLGDPLHVCLALTALYLYGSARLPGWALAPGAVSAAAAAIAVHEAAIFLCLPAIHLSYCARTNRRPRFHHGLIATLVMSGAFVVLTDAQQAEPSAVGLVLRDGTLHHAAAVLPSLSGEFANEVRATLGSPGRFWGSLLKVIGSHTFPLCTLLLGASVFGSKGWLRPWMLLATTAAPLYLVAHDWGRFAAYTALLAMAISRLPGYEPSPSERPQIDRLVATVEDRLASWHVPEVALVALCFAWRASHSYRVAGVFPKVAVFVWVSVGLIFALGSLLNRPGLPVAKGL